MKPKDDQRHCRYCGDPFKPLRSHQRFCRAECRISFHKMGGASEKRIQALIRPVLRDLFNDEEFLQLLRQKLA